MVVGRVEVRETDVLGCYDWLTTKWIGLLEELVVGNVSVVEGLDVLEGHSVDVLASRHGYLTVDDGKSCCVSGMMGIKDTGLSREVRS